MPISGGGNSEYDTNWNRIAQNEPLDLMLPTTLSISNFTIRFRIPNVSPSTSETLTGNGGSGAILWSITSENFQAYSSGEVGMITNDNINNAATITVANKLGFDPVSTNSSNLSNFFASKCVSGTGCTIKFSLVRPLALASPANTPIPYLEYQITVNGGQKIPNQYATIQAQGSSAGFSQSILRNVRQKTSVTGTEFATVN